MAGAKDRLSSPIGIRSVERFLRRSFGLAGPTVADHVGRDVAPSIDMRPVLPWELRDFGIIPWRVFAPASAVAAQFSYVEVQPDAATPSFDILITEIVTNGQPAFIKLHNTSQGAPLANPNRFALDSFWTPALYGNVSQTGLFVRTGTIAVVAGANVDGMIGNTVRSGQQYLLRALSGTPNLIVHATAVNTAIEVIIGGVLIPATPL